MEESKPWSTDKLNLAAYIKVILKIDSSNEYVKDGRRHIEFAGVTEEQASRYEIEYSNSPIFQYDACKKRWLDKIKSDKRATSEQMYRR